MKKYIKYLVLTGIIALGMTPAHVSAFDNLAPSKQPTGYRGVEWGSGKLDHPYLFYIYDKIGEMDILHRELEKLSFGNAILSEVTYHFYKDHFFQAAITLKSEDDHKPLLDALTDAYGKPEKESGVYIWENKTVAIRLFAEGASISYLPILNKIEQKQDKGQF